MSQQLSFHGMGKSYLLFIFYIRAAYIFQDFDYELINPSWNE